MRIKLLILSSILLLIPLLLIPGYLSAQSPTPTCSPISAVDSLKTALAAATDDSAALGAMMQAKSLLDADLAQCKSLVAPLQTQTRVAGATMTRQAFYDARTSTAAAIQATWTQVADNRQATYSALYMTQTAIGPISNGGGGSSPQSSNVQPVVSGAVVPTLAVPTVAIKATAIPQVVPPTVAPPTAAPPAGNGPTALCNDGTLSYSATHSGTCSRHKGVKVWYR